MSRVQIRNENNDWLGTECWIDGNKIPHVKSVDFHVAVDEVPTFKFRTIGRPDIDMPGQLIFDFSPENLSDACMIVSEELKKHGDFYDAFASSVNSVLSQGIQCEPPDLMKSKAEQIVNRIIGDE